MLATPDLGGEGDAFRKIRKFFIVGLLLALLVTVAPEVVHGCSCVIVLHPGEPLLANGRPVPTLDREPYLILEAADGRAKGFGGCNTFSSSYQLDEEKLRLRFERIVSTLMACAPGGDVEKDFHEVLRTVDNYSLDGDRLTLNRARMAPLARFEAVYLY